MSMERHVFFRGKLPSKAALAKTMRELGFRISIPDGRGSLEKQSGYLPMRLAGDDSGIEFDVFEGRETIEEFEAGDVDPSFDRSANFRWGGDEDEMVMALCASAALAKLTGGIVFEEEEGKLLSLDEAIEEAAKAFATAIEPAATKRPGTRHADVKRYVKPLLARRSDLVLIKRGPLLIRPVRHLLRGVFFEREHKFQFKIWRHLRPIYSKMPFDVGLSSHIPKISPVWQPHFVPELLDRLDGEVFASVGSISSIADYAAAVPLLMEGKNFFEKPVFAAQGVVALVLSGEHERAVEFVDEMERKFSGDFAWRNWFEEQRAFLARDIASICEECHAREERMAKFLRLDGVWEPSPFPVEVPAAERAARTNEPSFVTTPWVPRPDWLWGEEPEKPGEIRFAKDYEVRDDRIALLAMLSREQAEEMHRTHRDYVLAVCLPDGSNLCLARKRDWSPLDIYYEPKLIDYERQLKFELRLLGPLVSVWSKLSESRENKGTLRLKLIEVCRREDNLKVWACEVDAATGEKTVTGARSGEQVSSQTALTGEERQLVEFLIPAFGEFTVFVDRIRALLRSAGYGEFN